LAVGIKPSWSKADWIQNTLGTFGIISQVSATDLIRQGLKTLGLSEDELKASKGSEPRKVSLAWAIARSTTMSQSWIADRLNMRSAANVSQQVRRFETGLKRQTDSRIREWLKTIKNC
jgi:putative transposase